MQTYEFHPVAVQFGKNWPDAKMARIVADLKKHGFDRTKPIYLYQGLIIIGRNRYHACQLAGVEPRVEELKLRKDETLEEVVKRDNLDRSQYSAEEEAQLRAERIEEVVLGKLEGKSNRVIAQEQGVSETTIRKDLETATANGFAVDPPGGKSTGADGRTRTSTPKKKKKILCPVCDRRGERPNCADCETLRKDAKKKKKKPKPKTLKEAVDAAELEGEEEAELSIEERIKAHNAERESWCRQLMEFAKTMPDDPWMKDLNRRDGAIAKLRAVCDSIRSSKAHCACKKCGGTGCRPCHKTGMLTKAAFDRM